MKKIIAIFAVLVLGVTTGFYVLKQKQPQIFLPQVNFNNKQVELLVAKLKQYGLHGAVLQVFDTTDPKGLGSVWEVSSRGESRFLYSTEGLAFTGCATFCGYNLVDLLNQNTPKNIAISPDKSIIYNLKDTSLVEPVPFYNLEFSTTENSFFAPTKQAVGNANLIFTGGSCREHKFSPDGTMFGYVDNGDDNLTKVAQINPDFHFQVNTSSYNYEYVDNYLMSESVIPVREVCDMRWSADSKILFLTATEPWASKDTVVFYSYNIATKKLNTLPLKVSGPFNLIEMVSDDTLFISYNGITYIIEGSDSNQWTQVLPKEIKLVGILP